MAQEPIKVEGLQLFRRQLKALDAGLPKALRLALNTATKIVVDDAQPEIPRLTGRAASSLKTASTQNRAQIKAGGSRAMYLPWLDFGGKRAGRGGGIAERPFYKQGRYVWRSYGRRRDDVIEALNTELVAVAEQAGLEVT